MKLKSTYYTCEVRCPMYKNCASEFDHGHGPLRLNNNNCRFR